MIGIDAEENCPVVDTPLSQLTELFPDLKAVVVGIVRDGRLFVPRSSDSMLVGDRVYVVCAVEPGAAARSASSATRSRRRIAWSSPAAAISGFTSRARWRPAGRRAKVKIIEASRERAIAIADQLRAHRRPPWQLPRPGDPARSRHPGRRHPCRADQRRRGQHPHLRHGEAARLPRRTWRFSTTDPIPRLPGRSASTRRSTRAA